MFCVDRSRLLNKYKVVLIGLVMSFLLASSVGPLAGVTDCQAAVSDYQASVPDPNEMWVSVPEDGRSQKVEIQVTNTGTVTWEQSDDIVFSYHYEPGDSGSDGNTASKYYCSGWQNHYWVAEMEEASVAPGETAHFECEFCNPLSEAPITSDTYPDIEHFAMGHNGQWFDEDNVKVAVHFRVTHQAKSPDPNAITVNLTSGGTSDPITITVENDGPTTWTDATDVSLSYQYEDGDAGSNCGADGCLDSKFYCSSEWINSHRITYMAESSVAELEDASFTFSFCDPENSSVGSSYTEHFAVGAGDVWMHRSSGRRSVVEVTFNIVSDQPSAPVLHAIENADGDGNYTVSWGGVTGITYYELEEDDNSSFSSPTTVYNGADTNWNAMDKSAAIYYYRVRACDGSGCGSWSNVEFVVVNPSGTPTEWRVAWKTQDPGGAGNGVILTEGDDRQSVSVVFTNRSNGTVSNTGSHAIGLFVRQTDATRPLPDRFGDGAFACPEWLTPYHPVDMQEASVSPGGDITFEFDLCTNGVDPGDNYRIDFGVGHGQWFFETVGDDVPTAWYPVRVVTTYSTPPEAEVQPDTSESVVINPGQGFRFDASDSFDPDGGTLARYQWHVIRDPEGNTVNILLSDSTDPIYEPSHTPSSLDRPGVWVLQLTVTDDEGENGTTERTVVVSDTPSFNVPWFSQRAEPWHWDIMKWKNLSIHNWGCTLTSASMIFRYYGADTNPRRLNQAKGNGACLFVWDTVGGQGCVSYKPVYYRNFYGNLDNFSYDLLAEALSKGYLPIVGFCYKKSACAWSDHWVAVVSGAGNDPANYRVNDPWPLSESLGKNRSFAEAINYPAAIRVYAPSGACSHRRNSGPIARAPSLDVGKATSFSPETVSFDGLAAIADVNLARERMTLDLDVTSATGDVRRMQIGTQSSLDNARWVAYEPRVAVAWTTATLYMRFEDGIGTVSEIASDTLRSPNTKQVAYERLYIFLPLTMR